MLPGPARRPRLRTAFVSDVHLGCRHARAEAFLDFLEAHQPDYLYLVGDIIDGWRLRRAWHWQPVYNRIFRRLLDLAESGTQLRYAAGNHDDFLRPFLRDFGFVELADEFIHRGAGGRQFLVLHGDRFDTVELRAQWLSVLGAIGYDALLWTNGALNGVRRRLGLDDAHFCATVKRRVKQAVAFVSSFEERLARHAREQDCDAVICGHVHTPAFARPLDVEYYNTGDWVEHCTALLEFSDGSLQLAHYAPSAEAACRLPGRGARSAWRVIQDPALAGEESVAEEIAPAGAA